MRDIVSTAVYLISDYSTRLTREQVIASGGMPYTHSLNIVEEYDSVPSIVSAVKSGQGVFIVNQGHGRMFGEHVVVRPLKPAVFVLAYLKEGVSVAIAAFVAVARKAKLR